VRKNVASQVISAEMISATDGSNFTGTVTVYITGDGGPQTIGSVGSGICTHEGRGLHGYLPSQAETNFDHIAFTFEGTGAITTTVQLYTRFDANLTHWIATAPLALSSQQVQAVVPVTQKVDVETIKTQAVTLAGGVTIPAATLASTTNITAGTVTTVTNVTTVNGLAAGVITATSIAGDAITAAKVAADVTTEIQSGLATAAELAKVPKSDSNVTWNATALASIQSEAEDAIVAHRLDELLNADSDIDGAAPPTVGSVFHELMSKTAGSFTYDQTTDSLEALRDRGDAAWVTATGFATPTNVTDSRDDVLDALGDGTVVLHADYDAAKTAATQTSVNDLPTNSELATALGTADDATLAAIAALNNLSSAQAQTAAAAALIAYDPPTNAEMEARTLPTASYGTSTAQSTAQADLDILTGSDGVTLATSQPNYAPSTASALATVGSNVLLVKATTDQLADTLEDQGGGTYGFTEAALQEAPTGGSAPTAIQIADAVLSRAVSNVEDAADVNSLAALILATFESARSGTTWTIRKTGGTTFTTKTLTVDADADPITAVT
jgi:hypothetical protein